MPRTRNSAEFLTNVPTDPLLAAEELLSRADPKNKAVAKHVVPPTAAGGVVSVLVALLGGDAQATTVAGVAMTIAWILVTLAKENREQRLKILEGVGHLFVQLARQQEGLDEANAKIDGIAALYQSSQQFLEGGKTPVVEPRPFTGPMARPKPKPDGE